MENFFVAFLCVPHREEQMWTRWVFLQCVEGSSRGVELKISCGRARFSSRNLTCVTVRCVMKRMILRFFVKGLLGRVLIVGSTQISCSKFKLLKRRHSGVWKNNYAHEKYNQQNVGCTMIERQTTNKAKAQKFTRHYTNLEICSKSWKTNTTSRKFAHPPTPHFLDGCICPSEAFAITIWVKNGCFILDENSAIKSSKTRKQKVKWMCKP